MYEGDAGVRYWKISPGEDAWDWDEFRENDLIAIGWCYETDLRETDYGDITKHPDRELIKKVLIEDCYEEELDDGEYTYKQIAIWAGIIKDFLEIKPGDKVVVYDKSFHINALCEVTGEYEFKKELEYPHTKPVKWIKIFDPPLDIKPIKDKLEKNIAINRTVIKLTKKDWDIICNYAMGINMSNRNEEENTDVKDIINLLNKNPNVILYGPPGTGKTYLANKVKAQYKSEFITFHQSYSYEDFIEGIKPKTDKEGKKEIYYEIEDGLFKRLCEKAIKNAIEKSNLISMNLKSRRFFRDFFEEYEKLDKNKKKELFENADKFLLIIDEINRGNISKIFGELITLIEKDKRLGEEYEITPELPYSKEKFGVPPNVLLLGTMNTADRSIALLDIALRRRFDFYPMWPKAELLTEVDGINLKELLISMNQKINMHDRERQIGHSYFMVNNLEELKHVWFYKIMPLLQEYFYNDYEMIKEIIGEKFTDKGMEMGDDEFKNALKMNDDEFIEALNAIINKSSVES